MESKIRHIIRSILLEELTLSRDIIVTLPKNISWSDYKKELDAVSDYSSVINFKVNAFPKTKKGNKCYLVHCGNIVGWMEIVGLSEKKFTCSITGKEWSGKFIERSGPFHYIKPIPMKGFQGFRYFDSEEDTVTHNGEIYSMKKIFDIVKYKTIYNVPIKKLDWILPFTTVSEDRVVTANLDTPLIITMSDDKWVTIDGAHRLTKAVRESVKKIRGRVISKEELDSCKLS